LYELGNPRGISLKGDEGKLRRVLKKDPISDQGMGAGSVLVPWGITGVAGDEGPGKPETFATTN